MVLSLVMAQASTLLLSLPDLGRLREFLRRVQELLAIGGVTLAMGASFIFLLAWVVSHLRRPTVMHSYPVLSTVALGSAHVPVGLTCVAALGWLIPPLSPWTLKSFALAVIVAAFCWCIAVASIVRGGSRQSLQRARKALLLAGTPWYCLAVYLSTFL